MVEDNRISVNDLYEIYCLISFEIELLEKTNLSIKESINRLELIQLQEKEYKMKSDISLLESAKKTYQLQNEKLKKLSVLSRKIAKMYTREKEAVKKNRR